MSLTSFRPAVQLRLRLRLDSAPRGVRGRALASAPRASAEHAAYIRDVAAADAPPHLDTLLRVLEAQKETIIPPSQRKGLHPLVIPLSRSEAGVVGLLRWPTPPSELGLQARVSFLTCYEAL